MSISLRKACQPALDAVNLSHVHVGVKNKILTLIGPCGQPLVTVSGIEFDTNTPKKSEIPYAVKLFEEFISEKAADIATYLETKKSFNELVKPIAEDISNLSTNYRGDLKYSNDKYEVQYNDQKLHSITVLPSNDFNINDMPSLITEADQTVLPYFAALNEYNNKLRELISLQSQLQTCNI